MKEKQKGSNSNELTEKEKRIIEYRRQGHTYREICHDIRASPGEITKAEKKERGEYVPPRDLQGQSSTNFENYAEMYRLFSGGNNPREVAIAVNLPLDYVNEHYSTYLNSAGFEQAVQLYTDEGYSGITTLVNIRGFIRELGYADDVKSIQSSYMYACQVHSKGGDLAKMKREHDSAFNCKLAEIQEAKGWEARKEKAKNQYEEWTKKTDAKKGEYARLIADIERLKRENPNATALEAAVAGASSVIQDYAVVGRLALQSVISVLANNIWLQWYFLPDTRPEPLRYDLNFDTSVKENCQLVLCHQVVHDLYRRLMDDSMKPAGYEFS